MNRRRTAENQLKKLHGIPPHNRSSNIVRGDAYFARSIEEEFSPEEIAAAKERLGL